MIKGSGRKTTICSQDIIDAAIRLVGTQRSVSTLSLREVTRQAGIAPNSFYRHFKDIDELAIAIIEQSGETLRTIIRQARELILTEKSVVAVSVECFFLQMDKETSCLPILLREGHAGSDSFQMAVSKQVDFFTSELKIDLDKANKVFSRYKIQDTSVMAKAITQLVFAMGGNALARDISVREKLKQETTTMVKYILKGGTKKLII